MSSLCPLWPCDMACQVLCQYLRPHTHILYTYTTYTERERKTCRDVQDKVLFFLFFFLLQLVIFPCEYKPMISLNSASSTNPHRQTWVSGWMFIYTLSCNAILLPFRAEDTSQTRSVQAQPESPLCYKQHIVELIKTEKQNIHSLLPQIYRTSIALFLCVGCEAFKEGPMENLIS